MKLYVSNKRETPRMFHSDVLEFFTRVHWVVPLLIFVPVIVALLFLGATRHDLSAGTLILLFLSGLVVWTFTEYSLHRFVFHYHPKTEWGRRIHWMFHGVHHDYPNDPLRLVMVPSVSIPLAALFYLLFVWVMGGAMSLPFMAGFLSGYLFYDITHYGVHHFPVTGKIFGTLREWHMRHHFQDPENGFGVSSPLWDIVFRTTLLKRPSAGTEME
jgi:sterol desaturase/sphingolipid hydroxylase (fatty acid hydroxylase superfamily)